MQAKEEREVCESHWTVAHAIAKWQGRRLCIYGVFSPLEGRENRCWRLNFVERG